MAEFSRLEPSQREAFMTAVALLVVDLRAGGRPRPSLRVKRVVTHPGVWEIRWAADGRATFNYGDEVIPGERHILWRRIGTHEIFDNP
jgi:hypothetical protein